MAEELIEVGAGYAESDDFEVADTATVIGFSAAGGPLPTAARVEVQMLGSSGAYTPIGEINVNAPAIFLSTPGVYRFVRHQTGASVGVYGYASQGGGGGGTTTADQGAAGTDPWLVETAEDGTTWAPALLAVDDDDGTVAAGAKMVSVKNTGDGAGTVAGGALPAGETVTWQAPPGALLGAVAYDASDTAFLIATLAPA